MAGNDSHKQDQERELMFDKEGEQARPWKLPFWTEEVVHKAEREQPDTSLVIANRRRQPEPEPEPEIEEEIQLPTAEELENIRREAYNEGLEQGLVEGRQNGEKAGYDDGYAKGLETGKQEGEKAGNTIGFNEGKAEALKATGEQVEQLLDRFKALQQVASQSLIERDQQLPEMLAGLVMMACEQVLRYELADGAKNIHQYVRSALEQLPDGAEQQAKVFVSKDDASFLEGQLAEFGESLDFNIDPNLQAGECKVKTADSQVDYRVYDHLQQLLEQLAPALVQTVPDEETQAAELEQEIDAAVEQLHAEPESAEPESAEPESAEPESAEPESAEPESAEPESAEPESAEPETAEPESAEPESAEPESTEPEFAEPESAEPESVEPESVEPESVEPESVEPESVEPESVEAEPVEPESTEPESLEPESLEPESTEPESTEPESAEPEAEDKPDETV